jgi:hypothetical protein
MEQHLPAENRRKGTKMANQSNRFFTLRNLTEGVGKGFENLATEMIAKLSGKTGASLTMRLLVQVATTNEVLAKRIYELLRASETVAIFTAGSLEGLLPSIEKMEGQLGNFARVFRSFGVNLFERTFPHYFDQLKELADGNDFDGFRTKLGETFGETEKAMTGDANTVLLARSGSLWLAFRGKDDQQFIAWKNATEAERRTIELFQSNGSPIPSDPAVGPSEVLVVEDASLDEALTNPSVVFDPVSFRELSRGFVGGGFGKGGKKSVFSGLTDRQMRLVGKAVKAVLEDEEKKGKKPISLKDQWDQAARHCPDVRILQALAATVKKSGRVDVGTARVWMQQAGGHASLEMVVAQELSDFLGFAKMELEEVKKLAKSGLGLAKRWLEENKVARRLWWHGKVSFWTFIGATPVLYVVSTCAPDDWLTWILRVIMLGVSMVPAAYLVGWLLAVGWLAGLGRNWLDDVVGDVVRRVGKLLKIEEADERDVFGDFDRSKPMYWLGLNVGALSTMAFGLSLGLRLAEAVKHLHTVTSAAGIGLVMFLAFIIGGEFYSGRVKRMFADAMESVQKDVLGGILWWRLLRAKPAITIAIVMPVTVGALFLVNLPKIGQVDEAAVLFSDSGKMRLGDGTFEEPSKVLGGDSEFVKSCSVGGMAHVKHGVANLRRYVVPGGNAAQSTWFEFRADRITRVLYASRAWTMLLSAKDAVTVSGYTEKVVELPSGEMSPLVAVFPGATVEGGTNRVLVPCDRTYPRGSEYTDFRLVQTSNQKQCYVQATGRSSDDSSISASVLNSIWSWLDAKSWWAYALLSSALFIVGAGVARWTNRWVGLSVVMAAVLSVLMAFAT